MVGNVGRDAEVKTAKTGKDFATFSVALNSGSGESRTTTWVGVRTMQTNIAAFIRKGDPIFVAGDLTMDKGKDGKTYLNLFAKTVTLLGSKREDVAKGTSPSQPAAAAQDDHDDLPF